MTGSHDPAERVIVVGAGLAGLRACEGLRRGGYTGALTVFGSEPDLPYNRPPLSKAALRAADSSLEFRMPSSLDDVEWRLDAPVSAADLTGRTVTSGDEVLGWRGLVIATGLTPRRLDLPGPAAGRHVLRTVRDAAGLREQIRSGSRVVVVGAGFIGCEVALTLTAMGARVHLVEPAGLPMAAQLGPLLGAVVRRRLLADGVTLHLGHPPTTWLGSERVEGVALADGTLLAADLVVEAVGSVPNVGWLAGNGLDLSDGVLCDDRLRVAARADVRACGDVARFPHPLRTGEPRRMEHWTLAGDTGRQAGRLLARTLTGAEPQAEKPVMPSFWSDLGSLRLQSFGIPGDGMGDIRVLEGEPEGEIAVGYHRDGLLTGVVLIGLGNRYQHYRREVDRSLQNRALATSVPAPSFAG